MEFFEVFPKKVKRGKHVYVVKCGDDLLMETASDSEFGAESSICTHTRPKYSYDSNAERWAELQKRGYSIVKIPT